MTELRLDTLKREPASIADASLKSARSDAVSANLSKGNTWRMARPPSDTIGFSTNASQAAAIQIWEGVVIGRDENTMEVRLVDKSGNSPDHAARIDLEWVTEQDLDLVKPGSVFYFTLFKTTSSGTIRNSQELRFRRVPNWSESQIQAAHELSKHLFPDFNTSAR